MQKTQYSLCTLLLFLLAGVGLTAQVNHPTSGTVNETVPCGSSVAYFDSGGAGGNYSNSESGSVNFCPSTPGEAITIDFSSVDVEASSSGSGSFAGGCCWDALTISDANGTIFAGCGEDSGDGGDACSSTEGENGPNDLEPGDSFTSTAADGCLTVSFNSDTSQPEQGWEATVFCSGTPPPPSNDLNHPTSGTVNQTVTCGEDLNYYDSGGIAGSYSNSESGTVNFCPSSPGSAVTIDFSLVDIETRSSSPGCWDFLTISDDNGTLFDGCGEDSGDGNNAGTGADDLDVGDSFTSTAANGCLTVSFNSDTSQPESGWAATVSCMGSGPIMGCMDPTSCNYNPNATVDDGSCEYTSCAGCMDPGACNYDPTATIDDGSCEYTSCAGCTDPSACNYDPTATISDGSCEYTSCAGCTDPLALNYDPSALIDDGSCVYPCNTNAPLPPPWVGTDIGGANGDSGLNECDGSVFTSSDGFPFPNSDKTHFVHQYVCGNMAQIIAQVSDVSSASFGGIMFREDSGPGAKKVALKTQLTTYVKRDVRMSTNGFAQSQQLLRPGHSWLRIDRMGSFFQGYTSPNGVNWQLAFNAFVPMSSCVEVGLFVESPNVNTIATAEFLNINVMGGTPPPIATPDNPQDMPYEVLESTSDFDVYPNPAKDVLNVRLDDYAGQELTLTLTNNLGQVVKVQKVDSAEHTEQLNISDLVPGMYLISLKTSGDQVQTKKVIVK